VDAPALAGAVRLQPRGTPVRNARRGARKLVIVDAPALAGAVRLQPRGTPVRNARRGARSIHASAWLVGPMSTNVRRYDWLARRMQALRCGFAGTAPAFFPRSPLLLARRPGLSPRRIGARRHRRPCRTPAVGRRRIARCPLPLLLPLLLPSLLACAREARFLLPMTRAS
jgi:hypothetical protein